MKLYTGRWDDGTAGLLSGERIPKNHPRIDVLGAVDELGAALGVLRSGFTGNESGTDERIRRIQWDLYKIGASLSVWRDTPVHEKFEKINEDDIRFIEESIDELDGRLPAQAGQAHHGVSQPVVRVSVCPRPVP